LVASRGDIRANCFFNGINILLQFAIKVVTFKYRLWFKKGLDFLIRPDAKLQTVMGKLERNNQVTEEKRN
jgi:hypothetical protein